MSIIDAELVELAAKPTPRRVRTIEGAEFYGLPIGSIITADVVLAKNAKAAALGIKPPTGALSKPAGTDTAADALSGTSGASAEKPKASGSKKAPKPAGPGGAMFEVGGTTHEVDEGARLFKPKNSDSVVYSMLPDGKVYAHAADEVELPTVLAKALSKRFSGDLTDDPDYEEIGFDSDEDDSDVDSLEAGAVLKGRGDVVQFEKQEDGSWKHSSGVVVASSDLQHMVDSGELTPGTPAAEEEPAEDAADEHADEQAPEPVEEKPKETPEDKATQHKVPDMEWLENQPEGMAMYMALDASGAIKKYRSNGAGLWASDKNPTAFLPASQFSTKLAQGKLSFKDEDLAKLEEPAPEKIPGYVVPTKPLTPKIAKPELTGEPLSEEDIDALPIGGKVITESGKVYNKLDGVDWGEDDSADPSMMKTYAFKSLAKYSGGVFAYLEPEPEPDEDEGAYPPEPFDMPEWAPEGSVPAMQKYQTLKDIPNGTHVIQGYESDGKTTTLILKKSADNVWYDKNPNMGYSWTDQQIADQYNNQGFGNLFIVPESAVPAPPEPEYEGDPSSDPAMTPISPVALINAKPGDKAYFWSGYQTVTYVKQDDDTWVNPVMNYPLTSEELFPSATDGQMYMPLGEGEEPPALVVGSKPSSAWIKSAPVGAVISYYSATVGEPQTWSKTGDDAWLNSSSDITVTDKHLGEINETFGGKLKWRIADEGGAASAASKLEVGDKVPDLATMQALPTGTVLSWQGKFGQHTYTHLSDGTWLGSGGGIVKDAHLEGEALAGKLFVHTKALGVEPTPVEEPAAPEPSAFDKLEQDQQGITTPPASGETTPLWEDGVFKNSDLQEALTALENHSSFQVKYGLKSVPNNPLATPDNVEALKAVGQATFPDLKPKKAVIAFLQTKLGMTPAVEEKKQKLATGPSVLIGSADPKDTATGKTGGTFTVSEMEDAVAILEGYPGKLFKAELNKQDSPLGALNFNDIVGFDTDKTVVKQKVIDLLKKKISDNKVETEPAPAEEPDLIGELLAKLAKEQYEEEMKNPTPPPGPPPAPAPDLSGIFYTADVRDVHQDWIGVDIMKVHKLPENVSPPTITYFPSLASAHSSEGAAGTYNSAKGQIAISEKDMNAEGTIVHEYGHFLDAKVLGGVSGAPANYKFVPFWNAVLEAKTAELIAENSSKPAYHGSRSEIFARAYVQWIGTKTGKAEYKAHTAHAIRWTDEQFVPISNALDKLFKDAGLLNESLADDAVPTYAMTPTAVTEKNSDELYLITPDMVSSAAVGTVYGYSVKGGDPDLLVSKFDSLTWKMVNPGDANHSGEYTDSMIKKWAENGKLYKKSAADIEFNKSGLVPGKYSSAGGKVYMIVKADGTGIYVNSTGTASAMTVAKVKSNHAAGMNVYHGMPADIPTVAPKAPAKKAKLVADIPDGIYYSGSPLNGSTTVYEVKGDKATIHAPADKGLIGQMTSAYFMENAKVGATIRYAGGSAADSDPAQNWIRRDDGNWYSLTGELMAEQSLSYAKKSYSYYVITGTGSADPVEVDKAKLKTLFLKGKLADANGISVVPEGYSGDVFFLGSPNGIAQLAAASKMLENYEVPKAGSLTADLMGAGVMIDQLLVTKYVMDNGIDPNTPSAKAIAVKLLIDGLLPKVDLDIPEDENKGFEFNSLGEPKFPEAVVQWQGVPHMDAAALNSFIKDAGQAFGDGKTIGLHRTKMSKNDKQKWVSYFRDGNFKGMYILEVNAAAKEGKGHGSGMAHPGYLANEKFHKIVWGPTIEGEISALQTIEGEWTKKSNGIQPSILEIDNYLIKAQMKYPTYLTAAEKRDWVYNHQTNRFAQTNMLSVRAMQRAKLGNAPVSDPIVWTDDVPVMKAYDHLFEATPYPVKWNTLTGTVIKEYVSDHKEDFAEMFTEQAWDINDLANVNAYTLATKLNSHFQKLQDEADALALIPVYSKVKVIDEASTHVVWILKDQFDKKYAFKSAGNNAQRAKIEHQSNVIARSWGFYSGKTDVIELEGESTGFVQEFVDNVSNFHGINGDPVQFESLNAKQLGQVAAEHVLDWILDNDDTHRGNLLLKPDGNIVGIDKGRSFYRYGDWNGMSGDAAADSNASLAYTQMYNDIRSGKVSPENAQSAYWAAMKAAKRIETSNDDEAVEKLMVGLEGRAKWPATGQVGYFSGEQLPRNAEELAAAFLDRKHNLQNTTRALWEGVFKDAGIEMPTEPPRALGDEHFSGWGEADYIPEVLGSKVFGKAALHASGAIVDGSSLVWTEKTNGGGTLLAGDLTVGSLTQKKLVAYLDSQNVTAPQTNTAAPLTGFPSSLAIKKIITAAGKDQTKKAVSLEPLDTSVWETFDNLTANLNKDRDFFYDPNLPAPDADDDGFYTAPGTGLQVHEDSIQQYLLMMEHYLNLIDKVNDAKKNGGKTNKHEFVIYSPLQFKKDGDVYTNEQGDSITELYNGQYLWHLKTSQATYLSTALTEEQLTLAKFTKVDNTHESSVNGVKFYKEEATSPGGKIDAFGVKTSTDTKGTAGKSGTHYRIELPTGEEITFQNSNSTGTKRSQQGTIRFEFRGDPTGYGEALSRVEAQLEAMGLDMSGAKDDDAELIYWRQMFRTLAINSTASAPDNIQSVQKKLNVKRAELQSEYGSLTVFDTQEAIDASMTNEEEVAFYRELAYEAWGNEKVDKFLEEEKHLPTYQNWDISNSGNGIGQPVFTRIDVDLQELYKKRTMIALGNHSKDAGLLNYISSGGNLSTEERLRVLGHWKAGASSTSDQGHGSASYVFTRVATGSAKYEGDLFGSHVMYFNPALLTQVNSYAFSGDNYGELDAIPTSSSYDPKKWFNNSGSGNEALFKNGIALMNYMEIMIFDEATQRDQAIQRLKEMGVTEIRGIPIEKRLIMRYNLDKTMELVMNAWTA